MFAGLRRCRQSRPGRAELGCSARLRAFWGLEFRVQGSGALRLIAHLICGLAISGFPKNSESCSTPGGLP